MLTNETIRAIHENAVAHGFHEPDSEPTFGEYCALIHEEISEAFSAWRNGEPDEYVKDGKPEGVWVELADVVIRCADAVAAYHISLDDDMISKAAVFKFSFANFISAAHYEVDRMWSVSDNILTDGKGRNKCYSTSISILLGIIYARAELEGIDLDAIIQRKHEYNKTRPYKHGKRM